MSQFNIKNLQIYLLSNYPFYYALFQQCKINFDAQSKYVAYVKVQTKLEITINPEKIKSCSLEEQAGLLIHELQHVYKDHIKQIQNKQVEAISEKIEIEPSHKMANVAMDIEINPGIAELMKSDKFGPKAGKDSELRGVFPEDFKFQRGDSWVNYYAKLKNDPRVKKMRQQEQQMKKLQEAMNKAMQQASNGEDNGNKPGKSEGNDNKEGPHQDHDYFTESTKDEKMMDEIVANAARRAKAITAGSVPREIEQFLLTYENNSALPWNLILRQFVQSLVDVKTKNTWKKVNRRFRGKLPGAKKLPKLDLLIGIDSSGSVSDEDLKKFYNEVDTINAVGNVEVKIAVFDTNIHQLEDYKKGFEAKRVCSGGTSFIPVHQLALEEKYRGVIYLTDGYADFPDANEVNYKCLWVLNTEVKPPYGNTVRIK